MFSNHHILYKNPHTNPQYSTKRGELKPQIEEDYVLSRMKQTNIKSPYFVERNICLPTRIKRTVPTYESSSDTVSGQDVNYKTPRFAELSNYIPDNPRRNAVMSYTQQSGISQHSQYIQNNPYANPSNRTNNMTNNRTKRSDKLDIDNMNRRDMLLGCPDTTVHINELSPMDTRRGKYKSANTTNRLGMKRELSRPPSCY